jgi:hypothetical protein
MNDIEWTYIQLPEYNEEIEDELEELEIHYMI